MIAELVEDKGRTGNRRVSAVELETLRQLAKRRRRVFTSEQAGEIRAIWDAVYEKADVGA
jgi:hypothetical protein